MSTKNNAPDDGQKRVNISISPEIHAAAKAYAKTVGQDFSGLIAQLLLREMRDRTLFAASKKLSEGVLKFLAKKGDPMPSDLPSENKNGGKKIS